MCEKIVLETTHAQDFYPHHNFRIVREKVQWKVKLTIMDWIHERYSPDYRNVTHQFFKDSTLVLPPSLCYNHRTPVLNFRTTFPVVSYHASLSSGARRRLSPRG